MNIPVNAGLEGYSLPRKCQASMAPGGLVPGGPSVAGGLKLDQRCPIDPYYIVADRCQCVDYQVRSELNSLSLSLCSDE